MSKQYISLTKDYDGVRASMDITIKRPTITDLLLDMLTARRQDCHAMAVIKALLLKLTVSK